MNRSTPAIARPAAEGPASPTDRDDAWVPRIDRYEVLERIARGGMGIVYCVRDRHNGELRALKYIRVSRLKHAKAVMEGFEREYQVLKGLEHPRIIRVFDYGVSDEGAYYTMELLDGHDLRSRAPLPWREACQYLRDVATCLSLLHARRLAHRDLSPGNVRLTGDGHCKLIDFGALTEFGQTDTVIGTPPFVAPEIMQVGRLDHRADLFALGALGYYCLTGQHAYPAPNIDALVDVWGQLPEPPSRLNADVPARLDELVMGLLAENPLARPASAAEVITRLDAIAELSPEEDDAQLTLAQSFLAAPRYVGRERQLERVSQTLRDAAESRGSALRISAPAGAGRTRFLEEVAVRAQLSGAAVVRADASVQRGRYGVARALSLALIEAAPDAAQRHGGAYERAIAALSDARVSRAVQGSPSDRERPSYRPRYDRVSFEPVADASAPPTLRSIRRPSGSPDHRVELENWFIDVARETPLVVLVDNVEYTDDASMAMLIGLARAAADQRLVLMVSEPSTHSERGAFGLGSLQAACSDLTLEHLSKDETERLMRSLFGEAPRVERLADWLHALTDGNPLHCMELIRDLASSGVIRHERGAWVLPSSRPESLSSEALEDALARRLEALSAEARELAQCLSLQQLDPTLELCRSLVAGRTVRGVIPLLSELAEHDVLHWEQGRCFFSSAALQRAVLRKMDAPTRRLSHLRLGEALAELADESDQALRLEAGLHLIRGGDEMRGADMIAAVARNSLACSMLVANLHQIGGHMEAALKVYRAARKSRRDRMPLLAALALAGYYEHYRWAERYGDDALDIVEELSGLGLARRLRPYLGRYLSFLVALLIAGVRHGLAPRKNRVSFVDVFVHTCSTVTSLCGVAAISLDPDRCDRVADVLSPVAALPNRVALVGIYRFCEGLQQIAREHQEEAFTRFEALAQRFDDPKHYLFLPPETNVVYVAACHFARGAFAMMRADGRAALESAEFLERSELPLYLMIASQLRKLYHFNRGELGMAQVHGERVELHAARVGSAWQVELWEPASLIPFYLSTDDVVELARVAHRVSELSESVPSMWRYREFSQMAASLHTMSTRPLETFRTHFEKLQPRSFIGWSTVMAAIALWYNRRGQFAEARALCERALASMTDRDRDYVMIFLQVDIQAAIADAGLGHVDAALERIDHLLDKFAPTQHVLTLGLLHEARARIAFKAGRINDYRHSLREATQWLRPTGTPSLVALCDRLASLGRAPSGSHTPAELPDEVQTTATKRRAAPAS